MARGNKAETKLRVLAVAKILCEGKRVTAAEIMQRLDLRHGILVDRKTIYSDIREIDKLMPIEVVAGRFGGFKRMIFKE